jgi:plasmid stabilization system protein ParE
MAYRVQVAGPAERDLDRAVDYLVNVLGAPGAAMSLLDRYEEVLGLLADNPRLVRRRPRRERVCRDAGPSLHGKRIRALLSR